MSREINIAYANHTRLDYGEFKENGAFRLNGNMSFRLGVRFKIEDWSKFDRAYLVQYGVDGGDNTSFNLSIIRETGQINASFYSRHDGTVTAKGMNTPVDTLSAADNGVWHTYFWSLEFYADTGNYSRRVYLDNDLLVTHDNIPGPFNSGVNFDTTAERLGVGSKRPLASPLHYFNGELADVVIGTGMWTPEVVAACETRAFRDVLDADDIVFNPTLRDSLDDPITGIVPTVRGVDSAVRRIGPPILHHDQAETVLVIGDTQANDDTEMENIGTFINNYKDALKIKLAGHVGDYVQFLQSFGTSYPSDYSVVGYSGAESKARTFVNALDGVPFTGVMGNHDYSEPQYRKMSGVHNNAGHGRTVTNTPCQLTTTGTLPSPLEVGVNYWARPADNYKFSLHESYAKSQSSSQADAVHLTDVGTGTHSYDFGGGPIAWPNVWFMGDLMPRAGRSNYCMGGDKDSNQGITQAYINAQPWFNGDFWLTDWLAHWFTVTIDNRETLIFVVPHCPYLTMLDWIVQMCKEHSGLPVWLFTHAWLDGDGEIDDSNNQVYFRGQDEDGGTGNPSYPKSPINNDEIWDRCYKYIPNLSVIAAGHFVTTEGPAAAKHRTDRGVFGNNVLSILANDQEGTNGGNGYMQFLQIAGGKIKVETYRPLTDLFADDADDEQFEIDLPQIAYPNRWVPNMRGNFQ